MVKSIAESAVMNHHYDAIASFIPSILTLITFNGNIMYKLLFISLDKPNFKANSDKFLMNYIALESFFIPSVDASSIPPIVRNLEEKLS